MASAIPRSSEFGAGVRARHVHEGDDRQGESLGQLHDPHRLAVALRVRHPEVAPDVLVGVVALLLADDGDTPPVEPGEAGDHRRVVAEQPVAVELDEAVGHRLDELQGPRAARGSGLSGRAPRPRRAGRRRGSCRSAERPCRSCSSAPPPARPARTGTRTAGNRQPRPRARRPRGRRADRAPAAGRAAARARRADQTRAHDPVDEAVLEQELRALEAGRQLLGDGAGGHARAGEPDQRVGFGDVDVADRRERGEHAAGRRVGQDRQERDAAGAQALERGEGLGQLHQGQRALLHPGAARRADHDERHAQVERRFGGAGHLLADDGAHRAAHEPEVHHADGDPPSADGAGPPDGRVAHPGRGLGRLEAVGVGLLVDEAEAIHRLEARVALGPRTRVEELGEPGRRRQPEMVAAVRADPHRLVELLVEQHRLARGALGPQIGRVDIAAGTERRQLDRHQMGLERATARAARAIGPAAGTVEPPGDVGRAGQGDRGGGQGAADEQRPSPVGPGVGADPRRSGQGGAGEWHECADVIGERCRASASGRRPPRAAAASASSKRNDGWRRGRSRASRSAVRRIGSSGAAGDGPWSAPRAWAARSASR